MGLGVTFGVTLLTSRFGRDDPNPVVAMEVEDATFRCLISLRGTGGVKGDGVEASTVVSLVSGTNFVKRQIF